MKRSLRLFKKISLSSIVLSLICVGVGQAATQSGSVGLEGTIGASPPSQAATISIPTGGQSFTTLPITVSGLCQSGLLIKVFKNNIFSGSTQCEDGSYSLLIDLFNGQNDLVTRVYDALDQAGPDSNTVTVSFSSSGIGATNRVSITSNYAKRGANPGEELTWPLILSGGTGPYAISVNWGDGTIADLYSQASPGTFDVKHIYESAGVYNVIVQVTDANDISTFLQLVGVANGEVSQGVSGARTETDATAGAAKVIWWPAAVMFPLIIMTFWLGKRHQMSVLRKKLER